MFNGDNRENSSLVLQRTYYKRCRTCIFAEMSACEGGKGDRWMWDGTKIILQIYSDLKANSL